MDKAAEQELWDAVNEIRDQMATLTGAMAASDQRVRLLSVLATLITALAALVGPVLFVLGGGVPH